MEAIRLVKGGQAVPDTAKVLGIPKAGLDNWGKLSDKCQLKGAGDKPVSAAQMELARLRSQLARVKNGVVPALTSARPDLPFRPRQSILRA